MSSGHVQHVPGCHVTVELDPGWVGALDGGSPMSHVDFKKWQCPLLLFLQFPSQIEKKIAKCPPVEYKGRPMSCR